MYFRTEDSRLSREHEPRPYRFATGTRDNVRGFTLGPQVAGGTVSLPMSSSEIIEPLLMSVRGGVTPSTPGGATLARLWEFEPSGAGGSTALDSATIEWHDGARAWAEHGCYGNTIRFAGAANGEHIVTCELFGTALELETLTPALADRTPDFISGWETSFYIDDIEGPARTTEEPCVLLSWDVTIGNNLGRKYGAHASQQACAITVGELTCESTLTVEASDAVVAAEFANWIAPTPRLVTIVFGTQEIETGQNAEVVLVLPLYWTAFDLGQSADGTRVYELRGTYLYSSSLGYGVQVACKNARTTAWAA
jgi:hypothetical protein